MNASVDADQDRGRLDDGIGSFSLCQFEFIGGIGGDTRSELHAGSDFDHNQAADRTFLD